MVGAGDGLFVGAGVGLDVGAGVGALEGISVGAGVGLDVGAGVGFGVGLLFIVFYLLCDAFRIWSRNILDVFDYVFNTFLIDYRNPF